MRDLGYTIVCSKSLSYLLVLFVFENIPQAASQIDGLRLIKGGNGRLSRMNVNLQNCNHIRKARVLR